METDKTLDDRKDANILLYNVYVRFLFATYQLEMTIYKC